MQLFDTVLLISSGTDRASDSMFVPEMIRLRTPSLASIPGALIIDKLGMTQVTRRNQLKL